VRRWRKRSARTAFLRLARFLASLVQPLGQRRVLAAQHAAHFARGILGGHGEAEDLVQLGERRR